jgi:outer membrane receptor protein involved in Fe transport
MLDSLLMAGLTEVVITAQRRPEPMLQIAGSVSQVTPRTDGRLDLDHYASALNTVPGVFVQRGSGQESLIAIRSPVLTGAGACGAFLLLEDGMPLRPTGFCNVNEMFEVNTTQAAAIEVLRGPASQSYGANGVHGAINVITPAVAELAQAQVAIESGADDFLGARVSLAGDRLAMQALLRRDGGFRAQSPVEEYKWNLAFDDVAADGQLKLRLAATRLDQRTAGFVRGFEAYRDPVLRVSNPNPEAFRNAEAQRASIRWVREACDRCREEWHGVLRRSEMTFLQHFLLGKPLESNEQTSARVGWRRSTPWNNFLEITLGAEAEWADTSLLEVQTGPTLEGSAAARAIRPAGRHYDYRTTVTGMALHAAVRGDYPRYAWTLGLRADGTRYDYDNRMLSGNTTEDGTPCAFGGCLFSRPEDRRDEFGNLSPRLELGWKPTDRHFTYIAASTGFRPPEITELYRLQRTQRVADLNSESISALELGWRHVSERSFWQIAAFDQRKRDLIIRDANGFNATGGRSHHRGLEWEWRQQIGTAWLIGSSGTLARHRYDFDAIIEGGETIVRGRDIDTAPRRLHSVMLRWTPHADWNLALRGTEVGPYYADAGNQFRYEGHRTASLAVSWQAHPEWRVTLDIDNLTDERYADRADYAQGSWRYFPGRDRSVFLSLDWRAP